MRRAWESGPGMVNAKPLLVGVNLEGCFLRDLFFAEDSPEDNVTLRILRVVTVGDYTHLFAIVNAGKKYMRWLYKRLSSVEDVGYTVLLSDKSSHLIYVRFPAKYCKAREKCPLANLSVGFVPLTTIVSRDAVVSVGLAPSKKAVREMCENGLPVFMVDKGRLPKPLTDSQRMLLYEAFLLGYYEYPRRISLKELASRLGLSVSATAERLRKAEVKAIHNYILENILVELIVREILEGGEPLDACRGNGG